MKTQFLSKWRPRDLEDLLTSMARYTRFVFFSKYLLLLIGLLMLAAIIIVPLLEPEDAGLRIVFSEPVGAAPAPAEVPKMVRPQFQGTDSNGQPFTISADSAEQVTALTVRLTNLDADITLNNSNWVSLSADSGTYDGDKRLLDLAGNVQVFYDAGYEAKADKAHVDMGAGTVHVPVPVTAQGPFGHFRASGATFDRTANTATFTGRVYLTLYPGAK